MLLLLTLTLTWKSPPRKTPRNQASVPSVQTDDISALFLAMTHEGALLLAADQTLSAIY